MPQTIDDGRRAGVSSVADLDGFAARFAALPERLLDEAYGSRYAQHFYAPGEIAQFRHKWSKR